MQPYDHRAAREGGKVTNRDDRPASLDLKLCVLSRIFSDNHGWDYSKGDRSRQAAFRANVGWEFLGKIFPTGILDENADTVDRVFRREV
jgi:hypothetical protein